MQRLRLLVPSVNRLRLIPIVLVATACLLVLKTAGLVTAGGYTLKGLASARAEAQDRLPDAGDPDAPVITGTVPAPPPEATPPAAPGRVGAAPRTDGRSVPISDSPQVPPGERAVLERLQQRRQELERRSRALDVREGLLRAAEQRLEERLEELRALEARIEAAEKQSDEAEAARLKGIVTMYENMRPKDAARIFDRLDLKVLLEVALMMNPRRLSDIVAQMSPEMAQRLTVALAARAGGRPAATPAAADQLPKIEGRPRS